MKNLVVITTEDVQEALRLWHGGDVARWPLANLRLGLQVTSDQELYSSLADSGPAALNRAILNVGLEQMRVVNAESEELLRQRYEHRQDVMVVANSVIVQTEMDTVFNPTENRYQQKQGYEDRNDNQETKAKTIPSG